MESDSRAESTQQDGELSRESSIHSQPTISSEISEVSHAPVFSNPLSLGESEQLAYFRGLAGAAMDGLFVLDEDGRFEYANEMGLNTIQWVKQEVLGHHFLKFIPPDYYLRAMKAWHDVVGGNSGTIELEIFQGDGNKLGALIGYCPLGLSGYRKYGVSIKDIGAMKAMERQLHAYHDHIKQLYHQQGEQLNQIERQYYTILENAGYIATIVDEEGVFVYGNPVAERYAGVGAGGLTGKTLCDVFGSEQGTKRIAMLDQILAGKLDSIEDLLTIGGKQYCFDIRCWPLPTKPGEKRRALFFSADITEAKKTQEALRQSEELFRSIFDSSIDCIFIWDQHYHFLYSNKSSLAFMHKYHNEVVGYGLEEVLGWNPEYLKLWKSRIDRVFQTGLPECVEDKVFYDGQDRYTESVLFSLRNEQNVIFAVGAIFRDVTENRRTMNALIESEQRFRSLAEAAFEGIVIHDHGIIMDCNQRYAELLGYNREELIGRNGLDFIHPDDRGNMHGVKEHDYPYSYTSRMLIRDGSIRIVEHQGRQFQWEGRLVRVASARDITDRRKMEQELAKSRQRLQEMQKQIYLGSMGSFLAHELNQPLTVMELTLSESLRYCDDGSNGQSMRKIIVKNLKQIRRATETIQKFRRFFRPAALDVKQVVRVDVVIQRIKAGLNESARQAWIDIVLDSTLSELPEVMFSDLAIEQICMVLIQNAVDAANPNEFNKLVISGKRVDDVIEVSFSDDCGGVPEENREQVFEPFFTTKPGCLGLGLEIVRGILSSCGGSIRLETEQGKGCCFVVRIPITAE